MNRCRATVLSLLTLGLHAALLAPPRILAADCTCTIEGANVNVSNFPEVQTVVVAKATEPLPVLETGLVKTYSQVVELASGDRKPLGPFPLAGWRRGTLQITQLIPRSGIQTPLTARWYIRFHSDDVFFDPCAGSGPPACRTGFPPEGAKIRPLMSSSTAERIEDFYLATSHASIATLEIVGTEGLLILENTGTASRTVRVQLVADR